MPRTGYYSSAFCLDGFAYSGFFTEMDAYDMWYFGLVSFILRNMSGFIHVVARIMDPFLFSLPPHLLTVYGYLWFYLLAVMDNASMNIHL